ncbi:ral guanine nucleotide exchange; ral guanine nucl eotide dissociation [Trichuris trichiura]|uniref:Ral guanine nucleotide exchange ral guanine nucl eotide dissociation n=1 Tax=Trichuris trichiura TaxID=36087 RepID=A0A077YWL8_TRITR|nr:ral guanine nucleotide exchange; ral guanine nucl eotide dissociation [Trichuris trichiura]
MSSRYYGDEKQPDVHYAVYLKKVNYHSGEGLKNADLFANCAAGKSRLNILRYNWLQAWSDRDFDDDRLEWETIKVRVIKAATLQKWVLDMVIMEDDCARGYLFELFFETYRAVAKPIDVLSIILTDLHSLLKDKGSLKRSAQLQWKFQTWCTILRRWLTRYPEDFNEHPTYVCLNKLIDFSREHRNLLDFLGEKAAAVRSQFAREAGQSPPCWIDTGLISRTVLDYVANGSVSCYLDLTHADPLYIAEQLTCTDAELFEKLICYQCQSCFWSQRNKANSSSDCVNTVRATVDQFNAVARRVVSSVVYNIHEKSYYRAKIVSAWILVAQVSNLRDSLLYGGKKRDVVGVKNLEKFFLPESRYNRPSKRGSFSSPQRVVFGAKVETRFVFFFKNTQAEITSQRAYRLFRRVGANFSRGGQQCRISSSPYARGNVKDGCWIQNLSSQTKQTQTLEVQGTVPYLGTFLTDLTMIDSAFPDFTPEGLINVDKRRREYDIIGQLKIIQKNARYYRIEADPKFRLWFRSLPDLSEKLCYDLSCCIEVPKEASLDSAGKHTSQFYFDEHCDSVGAPYSPSKSGVLTSFAADRCNQLLSAVRLRDRSVFYQPLRDLDCIDSDHGHLTANGDQSSTVGEATILCCALILYTKHVSLLAQLNGSNNTSGSACSHNGLSPVVDDCYIVKVTLDKSLQTSSTYETLYKSVKLENSDRTKDLIRKALVKHGVQSNADQFSIAQILPNGKRLELPDRVNAFYAVSPCNPMMFILRRKEISSPQGADISRSESRSSGYMSRWNSTGTLAFV